MIKSYKQWMTTVHEAALTRINESRADDLVSILAKNSSFLPRYIVGDGRKFVNDWEKLSNKVVNNGPGKAKYNGGPKYGGVKSCAQHLSRADDIHTKSEVKTGEKNDIFKFPEYEESKNDVVADLERKRVYYTNAIGNMVRIKNTGMETPVALDEKSGLRDVYGLVHFLNMYNLKWGFNRANNFNWEQDGNMFKGYKKKIRQWDNGKVATPNSNSPWGRCGVITSVTGDSIGVSRMNKMDSVHGPAADWVRTQYDSENKDLTYQKTKTILIPLYTVHHIAIAAGERVPASEMVTRKIKTVTNGETTTLENSIAGVNKLFDQGKATISKSKLKSGLKVAVEKQLVQFSAITDIVVTGGASFEWQGGARNDEKNKALAESRAQYVANLIREGHDNLNVTTGGTAAAKIQPDDNAADAEKWRKVYLKITGTVTGDSETKEVSFEELESATWAKDKVAIDCYWIAIDAHNQNWVNPN